MVLVFNFPFSTISNCQPPRVGSQSIDVTDRDSKVLVLSEIPLFHVLNAKITFGNIGGGECSVEGVHAIRADIQETGEDSHTSTEGEEQPLVDGLAARCVIESTCFDAPADYREVNLDQPVGE